MNPSLDIVVSYRALVNARFEIIYHVGVGVISLYLGFHQRRSTTAPFKYSAHPTALSALEECKALIGSHKDPKELAEGMTS